MQFLGIQASISIRKLIHVILSTYSKCKPLLYPKKSHSFSKFIEVRYFCPYRLCEVEGLAFPHYSSTSISTDYVDLLSQQYNAMLLSCMEHIVHLLDNAASQIYSQATTRNIVLTAHERWFVPAYHIHVVVVCLHNFRISQVRLISSFEVYFPLLLRLTHLADGEVSPDETLRRNL